MPPPTIPLHNRSHFSFLEGIASPTELAEAAAARGLPAIALTDRCGLYGAVEFADACTKVGLRPIFGLELPVAPPSARPNENSGSLVLLAMDLDGWGNLCRLSSALMTAPHRDPSRGLPFESLDGNTRGLICLTGGERGMLAGVLRPEGRQRSARLLDQLRDFFPDRLYIELPTPGRSGESMTEVLASLAREANLPAVAAHSTYFLLPEQAELQTLLTAIRTNRSLDAPPAHANISDLPAPPGSHFLEPHELAERFADYPGALALTTEVAERCRLELPLGVPHYPAIELPGDLSATDALRVKAFEGAAGRYGDVGPDIHERLEHELTIIGERGYAPLFLIMQEILEYARATGVPTSSRGSAASSLVAHCLGITTPDPVRLDLYFERFLNPARATPPDIDTDLCSRRRDGVIRHVYERYGHDRVAMVCTLMRYRLRSALREAAKAHGFSTEDIKTLTEMLPYRGWGPPNDDDADAGDEPYGALARRFRSPAHQRLFRDAAALLGLPRHLSVHPGGVVIAPGPLTGLVPVQLASKGIVITQFDLDSIERLGLIKIDLLGIRGLTVLGDVAEELSPATPLPSLHSPPLPPVVKGDGGRAGSILDVLDSIPEDDGATSGLIRAARTIGCFQIESPGMRATLKEIGAQSVDDLMVALALYRPGPLTGGLKDAFVRRHRKQEPTRHLHPALVPLLEETHGVILYQEQVLRIAHRLAGLSLAEADLLRRAMSHFDPGKQMQTLKEKFVAGALRHSDVPPEVGERVWELMAAFAGYGFPKAHAASYAVVGWRAAWCKAHHPAEFMAAVLANWGGYYGQRVYLTEARRLGLRLRPPDVNLAQDEFSVAYPDGRPALVQGLNQVKELTRSTLSRILRERPFRSLADFLARADPRPQEAHNLVLAGALESFGPGPALLRQLGGGGWQRRQMSMFEESTPESEDWTLAEKVAAQESVLGVSVAAHPLELMAAAIADAGAHNTLEAAARLGQRVRVAGMRQVWRRARTATGDDIYFMSLEDLEGALDVVITSEVYRRCRNAFTSTAPLVVEGIVQFDSERGEPGLKAEKVWRV